MVNWVIILVMSESSNETAEEFAKRVISEAVVDIDIDYCKINAVKPETKSLELFNTKSNKAAFDLVSNL